MFPPRRPRTRIGHVQVLKAAVRERDGMRCTRCAMTNEEHVARFGRSLDVHRIRPGSRYSFEGCVTLCRSCHDKAAPRLRGRPDLEHLDRLAKIDADVLRLAKVVAASKGITLAEYLSEVLRPIVRRDYVRQAKDALKGGDD